MKPRQTNDPNTGAQFNLVAFVVLDIYCNIRAGDNRIYFSMLIMEIKKMARPRIWIPVEDIKGLKTLHNEGKTQQEIAEYMTKMLPYRVTRQRIGDRLKNLNR